MTHENVRKSLISVIASSAPESLPAGEVTDATTLDAFGVDSLVMIDLIFDLEQEFGLKLSASDLMSMKTVGDLVAHIEQHAAA